MLLLSYLLCIAFLGFSSTLGADNDVYSFWDAQCDKYYKNAEELTTEFPHMVALGYDDGDGKISWMAGGSLISDKHILTTASNIIHPRLKLKLVRMGTTNFEKANKKDIQEFEVDSTNIHPDFTPRKYYNNIAVVVLKDKVKFNKKVRPVCFEKVDDLNGKALIATGWGVESYGGNPAEELKKIFLVFGSYDLCKNAYNDTSSRLTEGILEEQHICAYPKFPGRDTCQGDTGGPLQLKHSKYPEAYNQVGMTSFGKGCGLENIPGVYTNVTHFLPWIKNTISN